LRARDLLRDFERDGLEVYKSPQTNLEAALATLKIPKWSDVSKQTSASPLLRSKKEVPDTADLQQVLTPEADQSVLDSDVIARVPSTR
jgi:hypothetical protein